jgi:hypothetical protein
VNPIESTTEYDEKFIFLKSKGLTWLPWVGQAFPKRLPQQRLLIVGQSHYYKAPDQTADDYVRDPYSTRDVVSEQGYGTRTWKRIPILFFNKSEVDYNSFWSNIAFYNFVQRPMKSLGGQREQPSFEDYMSGWAVFLETVKIVEPSHCLFIGVSAAKSFDFAMKSANVFFDAVVPWTETFDITPPKTATIRLSDATVKLIFTLHLSRCKNLLKWHNYLLKQHSDLMMGLG